MRIAVAGGTGTVGRRIVEAVRAQGDEPIVLARSAGVDLITGTGADAALDGVDAVIDAVNSPSLTEAGSTEFFTTASGTLSRAAHRAGARHLVLLSIIGVDRIPHEYYAGKLAQERTVEAAAIPTTIARTTQFHEFAQQAFGFAKLGPLHVAPRARTQPVAAGEVATHLARLAAGPALGRATDLAGPREERLDDMVRRYGRAVGHRGWMPSINAPGK